MLFQDQNTLVGGSSFLEIRVTGMEISPPPEIPGTEEYTILFQGQSSQQSTTSTNGRTVTRREIAFRYLLTPLKSGQFTLPDLRLSDGVQTITVRGITFSVKPATPLDGFHLILRSSQKSVYRTEPFPVEFLFLADSNAEELQFSLPFLENSSLKISPHTGSDSFLYYLNLGDYRFVVNRERIRYKGRNYRGLRIAFDITPNAEGTLILDTAYANFRSGGNRYSIPLNNPLSIQVKPLPPAVREGKGFVSRGGLAVKSKITPDKVYIGDPLELTLTVLNASPYVGDELKLLTSQNLWLSEHFVVNFIKRGGEFEQQTFTYQLRAKREVLDQFLPLKFVWFDLGDEIVKTIETEPLNILIEKGTYLTANSLEPGETSERLKAGFLSHLYPIEQFEGGNLSPWPKRSLLLFLIALNSLLLFGNRLSRNQMILLKRQVRKIQKEFQAEGKSPQRVKEILREWFSLYLKEKTANQTLQELFSLLDERYSLPPEIRAKLAPLVRYLDNQEYGLQLSLDSSMPSTSFSLKEPLFPKNTKSQKEEEELKNG